MVTVTSKITYPKNADSKKAYSQYITNLKKTIKNVNVKKPASVHLTCDGKVVSAEFKGNGVSIKSIKKAMFGKAY